MSVRWNQSSDSHPSMALFTVGILVVNQFFAQVLNDHLMFYDPRTVLSSIYSQWTLKRLNLPFTSPKQIFPMNIYATPVLHLTCMHTYIAFQSPQKAVSFSLESVAQFFSFQILLHNLKQF